MSRSRFEAEFRQAAGVSFGQFCLQMRLKAAARLLTSSDLTVKEVAARTGFWDDSHLHRAFLREYGQTPTDYREARQRVEDEEDGSAHRSQVGSPARTPHGRLQKSREGPSLPTSP